MANDEGPQAWVLDSQAVQLLEAGQALSGPCRPGQDDLALAAGLEIGRRAARGISRPCFSSPSSLLQLEEEQAGLQLPGIQ